jgi:hypothetical protein
MPTGQNRSRRGHLCRLMIRLASIERRSSRAPASVRGARLSPCPVPSRSWRCVPARAPDSRAAPPRAPTRPPAPPSPGPADPEAIPTNRNHAGRGGQEGWAAEHPPEGGPVEDHGPGVRSRVAGSPHRRGGLPRGRPGVRAPPRSLFLPPRALPWSSASPKRFSRKSRSRARSSFFATSPKDDIILTIKNHPSSSVSSLCSQ